MKNKVLSLRSHLMERLLTSLFFLWLASSTVGYFATINYANVPYDQILLERAHMVAEQIRLGSGQERFDFKPSLPDGNDPGMPDQVVYTVSDSNGKKIAGNADLSRPLSYRIGKGGPIFSNGELGNEKTRMVSLVYTNPSSGDVFQLHLSETVHQRQTLIRGILAYIVIPQLLLIMIAVVAVLYGLKHGLMPLDRLRREVAQRPRDDLSRLDEARAPLEVHPLIGAVNDLLERLKQAMQAQKRFIADAAHQLRTPLAGLKTQVELALRENDSERKQYILEQLLASARRSTHLVNQLLSLARNEPDGQGSYAFTQHELNQLAQGCTAHWVPAALEKNIDLGFEGAPQNALVKGDATSLNELLNNLIDNAIRYTQPGGHITVSVKAGEEGAELCVEDNGPGIEPQYRERVFERFFRILGSGQTGSGLGLAIVAEVAKRHAAELKLDAGSGGQGARVSIRFPRSLPDSAA
ncbi:MAG: sensor histidine kinase N-terminal domain-containing protein [Gallionellaceae bacterium]|nr:sensor histidine kinase N-terminal domain-containing protein [Gallionellaceae bacterium]